MLKIGIIGGGNMSKAIVLGLLANKTKAENIMVSDKDTKKLKTTAPHLRIFKLFLLPLP